MFPSRLLRIGLGVGVLLAGLISAGSVSGGEPQDSAKAQAKASSPGSPAESSSRARNKAKGGPVSLKSTTPSAASAAELDENVYRIGFEDQLQISVWHEPELNTAVEVRPDGKITLPLLNDIAVVGLRPDELTALLTEKLKAFVNEPQVTVIVRQIRSRKVSVFGQVVRQGSFPLVSKKTMLEVLAEAGGLALFAKSESIYILRNVNGEQTRIPFRYKQALAGRSGNPVLLPGDIVVVP